MKIHPSDTRTATGLAKALGPKWTVENTGGGVLCPMFSDGKEHILLATPETHGEWNAGFYPEDENQDEGTDTLSKADIELFIYMAHGDNFPTPRALWEEFKSRSGVDIIKY
jgi:hypothetical protein